MWKVLAPLELMGASGGKRAGVLPLSKRSDGGRGALSAEESVLLKTSAQVLLLHQQSRAGRTDAFGSDAVRL